MADDEQPSPSGPWSFPSHWRTRHLAGAPSVQGLYSAVAALAAYAIFGTCRDLNMGAESTVTLMAAAAVAPLVTGPEDVTELTSLAALLVGGWCVLGFVARTGFISEFLSRPILAGYVFGFAIIIVISQLESLFGLDIDTDLYTTDIGAVVRNLDEADGLTTLIGLATVALVLGLRRFVPEIPAPLVADQECLAVGASNVASGISRASRSTAASPAASCNATRAGNRTSSGGSAPRSCW